MTRRTVTRASLALKALPKAQPKIYFLGRGSEHRLKVVAMSREDAERAYHAATGHASWGYEFQKPLTTMLQLLALGPGTVFSEDFKAALNEEK